MPMHEAQPKEGNGMRKLLIISAVLAALSMPATALASYTEGQGVQVANAPDSTTLGTCRTVTAWRALYDAAGITVAKLWNHSHWCYHYAGKITYRTGYSDAYTAPGWNVGNRSWTKGWWTPYTSAWTRASGTFTLDVAGYHVQTWSPAVCLILGNKGGYRWC